MTFKGHGLVFVPETGKFARFTGGVLETTDPAVIKQLKAGGYESEGAEPEEAPKAPVKKSTKKGQA